MTSDDALAFDRHLDATAPAVADIARALRVTVLQGCPDPVETFDQADGLLAIGTGRSMRHFSFTIIPHKAHVNLQLADGVDAVGGVKHVGARGIDHHIARRIGIGGPAVRRRIDRIDGGVVGEGAGRILATRDERDEQGGDGQPPGRDGRRVPARRETIS